MMFPGMSTGVPPNTNNQQVMMALFGCLDSAKPVSNSISLFKN
jgi:hypothetical protein